LEVIMTAEAETAGIGPTVEILARAKTAVEDRVRMIRVAHDEERVEDGGLTEAEQAYAAARADVNGLIERLAVEAITDGEPDAATMKDAVVRATGGMQAFIAVADRVALGVARSAVAEIIAGVVEGLGKSLVDFWKAIRSTRAEHRHDVAEQLRRFLWLPFGEVHLAEETPPADKAS
jgi:hypothetical protein